MKLSSLMLFSGVITALVSAVCPAWAQSDFPSRPIRIIVAAGPSTSGDMVARAMADEMSKQLRVAVTIENREGSGGNVGQIAAARAAPDGYTILLATSALTSSAQMLNPPQYNPIKDFVPLGRIGEVPLLVVVGSETPFNQWTDIVKYARSSPGKMNFATMGKGSASHLFTSILEQEFSMSGVDVGYKSVNQGIMDTSTGKIDMYLANLPPAAGLLSAGKLRVIAVGSASRLPSMPNVPTFAELTGKPNFSASLWYGLFVPTGTPAAVVARLSQETVKAAATQQVKDRIEGAGGFISVGSGRELQEQMESDFKRFGGIIKQLGLAK